jgi:rare lipoprotein A
MKKHSIIFLLLSILFVSADDLDQPYNRIGYEQDGNASYYADKFHGRKTASGEIYDMYEMTAAHPRIRFNTKVKVTNENNDKSVIVRINDRGPYAGGRIIDLSKAAAQELDMIRSGVVPVRMEVVDAEEFIVIVKKDNKEKVEIKRKNQKKTKVGRLLDKIFNKTKQDKPKQEKPKNGDASTKQTSENQPNVNKEEKVIPVETTTNKSKGGVMDKPQNQVRTKNSEEKFAGVNTYSLWGTVKYPNGFGVQVASYTLLDKALEKGKAIYDKGFKDIFIQTGWAGDKRIFRILVGEGSSETVTATIPKLRASGYNGFVKQHY